MRWYRSSDAQIQWVLRIVLLVGVLLVPVMWSLEAQEPQLGSADARWRFEASTAGQAAGRYATVRVAAQSSRAGAPIRLQVGTFRPAAGEMLDIPPRLQVDVPQGDAPGYYILQFRGPVMQGWKERVTAKEVVLYDYIPDFAFLARMSSATAEAILDLDEVIWVGPYQPAYKISPRLAGAEGPIQIRVLTFPAEGLTALLSSFQALGGRVETHAQSDLNGKARLQVDAARIPDLARMPGVLWIEPYYEPHYTNDAARTVMGVNPAWTSPDPDVYGAGQTIAIFDTGIDTGSTSSIHADFRADGAGCVAGATSRVQILAYAPGCDGQDENSHGTHVAGSVAGNGRCSGGGAPATYGSSFAGVAPQASIVLQDSDSNGDSALECVPDLDTVLFPDAYSAGARLHTNSWGATAGGDYTTYSRDVDYYTWQNKDFTILFAAGNPGTDDNHDGLVDDRLLDAPGTAKNCITVGATENNRPPASCTPGTPPGNSCGYTQNEWGYWGWEDNHDVNPGHDDKVSDDPDGMAGFSGHGLTTDGRLKPDVVAPGTDIISVRTRETEAGTGWGVYDNNYLYMGGTSMATPLAAGAAVVVRDWLQDVAGVSEPSAALIKGLLIHGAADLYPGQYSGNTVWSHTVPNSGDDFGYSNYGGGSESADLSNWGRSGCSSGAVAYYWGATNSSSHSPSYSATSPSRRSCESTLFMKNVVDLPTGASPVLTYWHRFSTGADSGDVGYLELSTDGGISWSALQTYSSGKPTVWTQASVSLAPYAGERVKLRFRMATDGDNTITRWYVDDVEVDPVVARSEQPSRRPNPVQGWGRVDLERSIAPTSPETLHYWDASHGLRTVLGDGEYDQASYASSDSGQELRVTTAWTDYPGSTVAIIQLVNDLDLQVTGPGGTYASATARDEIAYDDGGFEEGWRFPDPNTGYAVRFTPSSYPATLTKARFYLDSNPNPFLLNVWDDDGTSGEPGTNLFQELVNPRGSGWVEFPIEPPILISAADFYIEMRFTSEAQDATYENNNPWMGLDCGGGSGGRSYRYDGSDWYALPYETSYCGTGDGRWGIRAVMDDSPVDRLNNVEGVGIDAPANGDYTIRVTAYNVPQDDPAAAVDGQPYALVASGALGTLKAAESYHYVDAGDDNDEPFGQTGVTMNFASGPGGYVTVTMDRTAPSQAPPSGFVFMNVQWDLASAMSGFNAQIVFHYEEADLPPGMDEASMNDGAYRWAGSAWEFVTGTQDTAANTVTVDGVTSFSTWTLGGPKATAVDLAGFEAQPMGSAIQVVWETASEVDVLGFNLYRSNLPEGPYVRLNDALIPGQAPGSPEGARYAWLDSDVAPDRRTYYRLEILDTQRLASLYGPVWAVAPRGSMHRVHLPLVTRW